MYVCLYVCVTEVDHMHKDVPGEKMALNLWEQESQAAANHNLGAVNLIQVFSKSSEHSSSLNPLSSLSSSTFAFFLFPLRQVMYKPGWPWTHYTAKDDL